MTNARPKMIFLVTEDWYFYSHRLPMARAAIRAGYDVTLAANIQTHGAAIEAEGVRVIHCPLDRGNMNPLRALRHIAHLYRLYRTERPALVHHIAMKPVLFGAVAAWCARVPHVVNAFAGLGYLFAGQDRKAKYLRRLLIPVFRFLLKRPGSVLLLQNNDDRALLARHAIKGGLETIVIRGSGVDLDAYPALPLPDHGGLHAIFAGRMIDIKGLGTMRDAFAILARTHPHITLTLCGAPDPANPGSWDEARLRQWANDAPNVTYRGHCADMKALWAQADLALQPSWGGEGLPKSMLEAAACARPIIASDVAGCREVVKDGVNGFLVPARDAAALAHAIIRYDALPHAERAAMASASRALVADDLSAQAVSNAAESLYRRLSRA